jgi:hypothetical protein
MKHYKSRQVDYEVLCEDNNDYIGEAIITHDFILKTNFILLKFDDDFKGSKDEARAYVKSKYGEFEEE